MSGNPTVRAGPLLLAGLLLATMLAACGESGGGGAKTARGPRLLRVLDPGGRLYLHGSGPDAIHVPAPGEARRLRPHGTGPAFELEGLPPGGEVVVVAAGCRVERAPLPDSGHVVVRLRRGIPVRVRLHWDGEVPEEVLERGVGLSAAIPADAPWARVASPYRSIGTDWMDEDRPTKPDWTVARDPDAEVLLFVPEPGTYALQFTLSWPSRQASWQEPPSVAVGPEGTPAPVEAHAPARWLERVSEGLGSGGPR